MCSQGRGKPYSGENNDDLKIETSGNGGAIVIWCKKQYID